MGSLPRVRVGGSFSGRKVLGDVEAAHVRVHRLVAGVEGASGVRQGVPPGLRPHHRIRQQASGAVHLLHRLQARRLQLKLADLQFLRTYAHQNERVFWHCFDEVLHMWMPGLFVHLLRFLILVGFFSKFSMFSPWLDSDVESNG
ncbi:unnamed protein product [Linum tenue]|uniref:Uncharacterized protein n=1 Tax=Linum tenue TaxID=586396 RepID=A0AAV0MYM1_9ROSI|nr:unnamed protein product [Linum tenue]